MSDAIPLHADVGRPESFKEAPSKPAEPCHPPGKPASTYGQIFRSTALIGGSSVIDIAFRIIRVKLMAVLLGPAGIGLFGLFNSIADLGRTLGGLGISLSGARQIAEAYGSNDARRIAVTVITLRRVAFVFGCAGALLLAILSKPVSRLTFGDEHYAGGVLLLSLTVLFATVSDAQMALIRGLRRIGDLAWLGVLGAFLGTAITIPVIYFFRERGIVPSIVGVAGMGIVTSWWYARKVRVESGPILIKEVSTETATLLKLGVVLMLSALLPAAVGYAIRIMVQQRLGIDAAGFYQAAWALSILYVNFILQAMGTDFYPRLTAASKDDSKCNQMMNEQAEVGLLLAGPGVMATLTFAPLVIHFFYSAKFGPTVELLRWNCLGMMIQVAGWPLATLQLAKGRGNLFFCTQLTANAVFVLLAWFGIRVWGLTGTAIAFCGMIAVQCLISYAVARKLSGFRWSPINLRLAALFLILTIAIFLSRYALSFPAATALGVAITLAVGIYSLKLLCALIPIERMPVSVRKVVEFLRLASSRPKH